MGDIYGNYEMIPTFICRYEENDTGIIAITGSEAHHIASVLRLGRGDMIRIIDGRGQANICEISSVSVKKVACRIIKTLKNSGEPSLHLTLAIGLSSASKFDAVMEKATEVGVSHFIPLLTEKGKVKLGDKAALTRKINRWRRLCEAAVKQSGRSYIPVIDAPVWFDKFLDETVPGDTFLFHSDTVVDELVSATGLESRTQLTIIIGPESGLSKPELEMAHARGIRCLSLGTRVLRTETAGSVIPALLIYLSEMIKS
jgi:16S rRNA (uracil1498-N3)-methyltransferase